MEDTKPKEALNRNLLLICGTIVLCCLVISGTVLYAKSGSSGASGNDTATTQQPQQNNQSADISKVTINGEPFYGNANAPVVIAYWSDYQCPFCKKTEQEVLSQVITEYVKTGKAKIVYKDYQFLGADSMTAGWAEKAVWEVAPDKFYDWHKAMYEKQDGENSGWGSKADILALAKSLGIDSIKVGELMVTKVQEYQKAMDADKAEGASFGINGTPGTIIGKQLISGSQPYSVFKAAIDQALSGK